MTSVGRFKKCLAVILTMAIALTMLPGWMLNTWAAGTESSKITLDICDGSVLFGDNSVMQNGHVLAYNQEGYIIIQSNPEITTNTINVIGGSHNITISGINIDKASTGGGCAFSVFPGATVNLTLKGSNTLESGMNCAGLNIPVGASVTINGSDDDSLNATGGPYAAGIGGNISESCGSLIINGGVIKADCYYNSAGIGGGGNGGISGYGCNGGDGGTITITGGTVIANGNRAAGIGGGGSGGAATDGNGGKVIISGGTVTAAGGVSGAGIGGGGKSGNGGTVEISGGTVTAIGGAGGIGAGNGFSETDKGTCIITGGSVNATELRHHTTYINASVSDKSGNAEHCVTVTTSWNNASVSGTVTVGPTSDMRTDGSGKLYFWVPENQSSSAAIKYNTQYYGLNIDPSCTTVTLDSGNLMTVLYVDKGDIFIAKDSVAGKDANGNTPAANADGYVITQNDSNTKTTHTVSVSSGTHNIVLESVNIDVSKDDNSCSLSIDEGAKANLVVSGDNALMSGWGSAGLRVPQGASASISGGNFDSLTAQGGEYGAGIGNDLGGSNSNGDITINGGNIKATGGYCGAGIGGGSGNSHYDSGMVTINDGTITASGGCGAGIGGGFNGSAAVTINGGTINAASDAAAGIGDGCHNTDQYSTDGKVVINGGIVNVVSNTGQGIGVTGYIDEKSSISVIISGGTVTASSSDKPGIGGTVKITGGSVAATLQNRPTNDGTTPVYCTTVSVPKGKQISVLTVKQNGKAVTYGSNDIQTDSSSYGKLYLWLPSNDITTADLTTNGGAYRGYRGSVSESDENVLKMDQNITIGGITNNSSYTYGSVLEIFVTGSVPDIAATVVYSGTGGYDSSEQPANAGTYTVTASKAENAAYYPATASAGFTITRKELTDFMITPIDTQTYTGNKITPDITVKDGENKLVENTDYTVFYFDNINAGIATATVEGKGNYTGTRTKNFIIEAKNLTDSMISNIDALSYTGGTITPTVTVKDGGKALAKDVDYTISYSDNTDIGIATVTVVGKGNYTGTATAYFAIVKGASSVTKLPVAADIPVIGKLSSSILTGGEGNVTGTFSWAEPDTVVTESGEYEITFTPDDLANYSTCTCKMNVTVLPEIINLKSGVIYDVSKAHLPDGVTGVSAKSYIVSDSESSAVKALVNGTTSTKSVSGIVLYGLSLLDQNGSAITEFTGTITVKIPIPDGMSGDLHVYWYNDANSTVTDMNARRENGYLVFETTHFSFYTVAELSVKPSSDSGRIPNPNTGSYPLQFMQAWFGVSGLVFTVVTGKRRSRKKR